MIAARTGIPQAEAEQRVNQTIAQAKDAADKARRAAARFSIWIAISLLAGRLRQVLPRPKAELAKHALVRRGRVNHNRCRHQELICRSFSGCLEYQ